ncbi:MAG: hypothetical protein LUG18_06720 [Candidatus Azobacteroides sp.]|nr:hypothetical protein [Candidatus Azobacteroides sp.]
MNQQSNQQTQKNLIDISSGLMDGLTVHQNIQQEVIVTTEDKIRLILQGKLTSQKAWLAPFGLLISFIATLCTTDFKAAFGLSKDVWHAIFIILVFLSAIWLIYELVKLWKNWNKTDMDSIIREFKIKQEEKTSK